MPLHESLHIRPHLQAVDEPLLLRRREAAGQQRGAALREAIEQRMHIAAHVNSPHRLENLTSTLDEEHLRTYARARVALCA